MATTQAVLRIEHGVPDYQRWKAAFDADPLQRAASGVIGHRVMRATDDPNLVMIDLEFGSPAEAAQMAERLRGLWSGVAGAIVADPHARVVEVVERAAAS